MRVGDRFEWAGNKENCIDCSLIEIISEDEFVALDIKPGQKWAISCNLPNKDWQYIGNFSKSSNFSNLYSILSELSE